jgi:hypothetical protein
MPRESDCLGGKKIRCIGLARMFAGVDPEIGQIGCGNVFRESVPGSAGTLVQWAGNTTFR